MSWFDAFKNILKVNKKDDSALLIRPTDSYVPAVGDVAKVPILPMNFKFMYDLYYHSDVLRTVIKALVWEIFRNGIEIKRRFELKCVVCGKEYTEYVDECDECGSKNFREPNWRQKKVIEKFFEDANLNDQALIEVLKDIATDVAVTDNGFLVVIKEYEFDNNGDLIGGRVVEILRGSPLKMRLIINKNGRMGMTDDNRVVAFCLNHRSEFKLLTQEEMKNARCDKCNCRLFPAYYKLESTIGKPIYYTDGEVLHIKIFTTGIGYGYSPIMSIWIKLMILMKQDWFVLMAYHLQRPPKALLLLRGNRDSIAKAWEWLMEQNRVNPHMIAPLVIEGVDTGKRIAEFIDLTVRSDDINFIEYRNELRRSIGAVYGVMPLWQGDARGGLANEGLQITVTNRTVDMWQEVFNNNVLKWLVKQLGVTDYDIELRPNEMRDEVTKLEIELRKIQVAKEMRSLGYEPILVESKRGITFKYTKADSGGVGEEKVESTSEQGQVVSSSVESVIAEGEPESMRPRRTEQRFEGEPAIPRR